MGRNCLVTFGRTTCEDVRMERKGNSRSETVGNKAEKERNGRKNGTKMHHENLNMKSFTCIYDKKFTEILLK